MEPIKTVAFLARYPGFLVLRELMANPLIDLQAVYTHGLLPKAEGSGVRPELYHFRQECAGVPLFVLDAPMIQEISSPLVISLSWRHKIPTKGFVAGINIHRGELPKYAGAEPIKQALEAGEKRFAITAHKMTDEIDRGDPLAVVWAEPPVLETGAVRDYLVPLYVPLVRLAIEAVVR